MKAAIKRAIKRAVMASGLAFRQSGSRILTYHSVGRREHEMNVTPAAFREQMAWLASHARVMDLPEAAAGPDGIAITFDDGYRDNLTEAAPILREFGLPATCFVVAGRIGQMLDHDRDPETAALMSWDEIAQWRALGLHIGAHSMTHRRLSLLSEEEQRVEIVECHNALVERYGPSIDVFAYPFGAAADYNDLSRQIVRDAGFACAVSNRYGVNDARRDPWALRRIWIDATDDLATFRAKVDGRLDALALLDSPIGLRARRTLNRLLGVS